MDNYQTAYNNAINEPPFSNGTEGYGWMYSWCDRCAHDAPFQRDESEEGCPLVAVAFTGRTPREWIPGDPYGENGFVIEKQYSCIYFRDEDDEDPDPKPLPDPPGMDALFPREACEGPRILLPVPQVPVREAVAR